MSDVNGSVDTGNPDAPNPAVVQGSSDGGQSNWDGLSEDNRSFVEAKGWKGADDSIASYRQLEAKLGSSLSLPDKDDETPERFDKIYRELGWPDKPDGYEFKLDTETVPENMPYDEGFAESFREFAHEQRMPAAKAQALHDWFVSQTGKSFEAAMADQGKAQAEREAKADEEHRNIVQQWGKPDSQEYRENVQWADRALRETGLREAFEASGLLAPDGAVLNAKAAFALETIGRKMYGEDSTGNPLASAQSVNPFSGDTRNRTEQARLVKLAKDDPSQRESVVRLIRQAGDNPASFGIG